MQGPPRLRGAVMHLQRAWRNAPTLTHFLTFHSGDDLSSAQALKLQSLGHACCNVQGLGPACGGAEGPRAPTGLPKLLAHPCASRD
jgi:hypothetical protein